MNQTTSELRVDMVWGRLERTCRLTSTVTPHMFPRSENKSIDAVHAARPANTSPPRHPLKCPRYGLKCPAERERSHATVTYKGDRMTSQAAPDPTRRRLVATGLAMVPGLCFAGFASEQAAAQGSPPRSAEAKVNLAAADGHRFAAWRSDPADKPKGGIVVLHAVFGLTPHMGGVCARWADAGYSAIAPALFDRHTRDLVHPYTQDGVAAGSKSYAELSEAQIMADIQACAAAAGPAARVAISGFCTGGSWSWKAAAKLDFAAQVNFYGSHVFTSDYIDLEPRCPTILHYGDADPVVPMPEVQKIHARHPAVDLQIYPGAVHAFENPDQASYNASAAALAWQRSIAFMDRHVAMLAK